MANNKNNNKRSSTFMYTLRRMVFGVKASEMTLADERYDSPGKLAFKRFFRKPLAFGAVILLICMFAFVIIGPMFAPVDLSYMEALHTNVAPNMSMMSLPSEMKDNPRAISSNSSFSVGVDKNGKTYVWGYFKSFSKVATKNVMNIPEEVKNADIMYVAAGYDHIVAIGSDGTIYAWGANGNGQYGREDVGMFPYSQPQELINGKIDINNVKELVCGYQTTVILMKDGTMYAWGNTMSSAANLPDMLKEINTNGVRYSEVCLTNSGIFAISTDGKFIRTGNKQYDVVGTRIEIDPETGSEKRVEILLDEVIGDRKVVDMEATNESVLLVLDDNTLMPLGKISTLPELEEGETLKSISAASRHITAITSTGRVVAWGNGALGQTDVPNGLDVDEVISTGFQNYAFKDGKFVDSWGLKGYLFGTDDMGRDVFNRVMNGGKMTMTIGAVAVIVSSIIGIIIGCLAGYFGGMVDLLLMRVTEIFSAIPFLPFALVLSAVLQGSSLTENTRIFIIMIILGLLSWTGLATMVRGQILAEREKEFVTAAKSMGVKETRIAFRHILPNIISVILVSLTLSFASCMLTESSLSYLGFGVKLPRPTWGNMLDGCRNALVIQHYWWRWLFPAIFLAVTVICINVIGDTLRDVLDPKSEVEK